MTILAIRRTGPASDVPFVLVHAMPLDSTMWDEVRQEMDGIDVLTVDVPGFGMSPSGSEVQAILGEDAPSLKVIVEALKKTLDDMGVESIVLGGMSMGGGVAAAFADAYPEMVVGLALMDTNIEADPAEHRQMRLDAIELCRKGDAYGALAGWTDLFLSPATGEDMRASFDRAFQQVKPESLAWLHKAMMNREDCLGALAKVRGPILLERGVDDATCSLETLERWRAHAPGARIVEIPRAGHFVANEQPVALAAELMDLYTQAVIVL